MPMVSDRRVYAVDPEIVEQVDARIAAASPRIAEMRRSRTTSAAVYVLTDDPAPVRAAMDAENLPLLIQDEHAPPHLFAMSREMARRFIVSAARTQAQRMHVGSVVMMPTSPTVVPVMMPRAGDLFCATLALEV